MYMLNKRKLFLSSSTVFITCNLLLSSIVPIFATEVTESESIQSSQDAELPEVVNESEELEAVSEDITNSESTETQDESLEVSEETDTVESVEEIEPVEVAETDESEPVVKAEELPEVVEGMNGFINDPDMTEETVGFEGEFGTLEEHNREDTYDLAMQLMYMDLEEKDIEPKLVASTSYTTSKSSSGITYVDDFINTIVPYAIEDSIRSGILPSITIAQGALESAWGLSGLTKQANNLFGIKDSNDWTGAIYNVVTAEYADPQKDSTGKVIKEGYWYEIVASFRKYSSWLGSIRDHGDFFTSTEWRKNNYRFVVGEKNYKKAAQALQDAGYATDPTYARKLISIIENYDLSKYDQVPVLSADYHVQKYGWLTKVGTELSLGHAEDDLRIEDFNFTFPNNANIGINYSAHIQKRGWINNITTGNNAGNIGKSMRMEAVKLNLTGEASKSFDIYYRVYSDTVGWSGWAKNGSPAGTEGYAKKIRSLEIKIAWKDEPPVSVGNNSFKIYSKPNVNYTSHVQSVGWMDWVDNGKRSGTMGRSLRLEGLKVNLSSQPYSGSITYQTHVQTYGWLPNVSDGSLTGTVGEKKRLEAVKINLTGTMAEEFDVYYRTHIQTYGWTGWAKNGQPSGSEGLARRLEAMEVKLVEKGGKAPGTTNRSFYK